MEYEEGFMCAPDIESALTSLLEAKTEWDQRADLMFYYRKDGAVYVSTEDSVVHQVIMGMFNNADADVVLEAMAEAWENSPAWLSMCRPEAFAGMVLTTEAYRRPHGEGWPPPEQAEAALALAVGVDGSATMGSRMRESGELKVTHGQTGLMVDLITRCIRALTRYDN